MDTPCENNKKNCDRGLLVVSDPNLDGNRALERAVKIAEHTGAPITLIQCLYSYPASLLPFLTNPQRYLLKARQMEQARKRLEKLALPYRQRQVSIDTRLLWQRDAAQGIIDLCRDQGIDLVIIDRPPRHRWFDQFWPSVDHRLLNDSPVSILLVGRNSWHKQARVLSAVDTCHDSAHNRLNEEVLQYTQALGHQLDANIHLCNAYPGEPLSLAINTDDQQALTRRSLKSDHQEAIRALAERFSIPPWQTHVFEGLADDALPEAARAIDADLLIVGHSGRHGLAGSVLGNTSEFLMDDLECDMLSVRSSQQDATPPP